MKKNKTKKLVIPIVAVIFNNKNQVLLTKRYSPKNPSAHKKWHLPGGGMKHGEHPRDTVMREIHEELAIAIELLTKHPLVYSYMYPENNEHRIKIAYPAKYLSGTVDISGDEDATEAKWFRENDIKEGNCLPQTKEVVIEAKQFLVPKRVKE